MDLVRSIGDYVSQDTRYADAVLRTMRFSDHVDELLFPTLARQSATNAAARPFR